MAKINKKYKIKGSNGIEEISLYTTKEELGTEIAKHIKLDGMDVYYPIGPVDHELATKKRLSIRGIVYAGLSEAVKTLKKVYVFEPGVHEFIIPEGATKVNYRICGGGSGMIAFDSPIITAIDNTASDEYEINESGYIENDYDGGIVPRYYDDMYRPRGKKPDSYVDPREFIKLLEYNRDNGFKCFLPVSFNDEISLQYSAFSGEVTSIVNLNNPGYIYRVYADGSNLNLSSPNYKSIMSDDMRIPKPVLKEYNLIDEKFNPIDIYSEFIQKSDPTTIRPYSGMIGGIAAAAGGGSRSTTATTISKNEPEYYRSDSTVYYKTDLGFGLLNSYNAMPEYPVKRFCYGSLIQYYLTSSYSPLSFLQSRAIIANNLKKNNISIDDNSLYTNVYNYEEKKNELKSKEFYTKDIFNKLINNNTLYSGYNDNRLYDYQIFNDFYVTPINESENGLIFEDNIINLKNDAIFAPFPYHIADFARLFMNSGYVFNRFLNKIEPVYSYTLSQYNKEFTDSDGNTSHVYISDGELFPACVECPTSLSEGELTNGLNGNNPLGFGLNNFYRDRSDDYYTAKFESLPYTFCLRESSYRNEYSYRKYDKYYDVEFSDEYFFKDYKSDKINDRSYNQILYTLFGKSLYVENIIRDYFIKYYDTQSRNKYIQKPPFENSKKAVTFYYDIYETIYNMIKDGSYEYNFSKSKSSSIFQLNLNKFIDILAKEKFGDGKADKYYTPTFDTEQGIYTRELISRYLMNKTTRPISINLLNRFTRSDILDDSSIIIKEVEDDVHVRINKINDYNIKVELLTDLKTAQLMGFDLDASNPEKTYDEKDVFDDIEFIYRKPNTELDTTKQIDRKYISNLACTMLNSDIDSNPRVVMSFYIDVTFGDLVEGESERQRFNQSFYLSVKSNILNNNSDYILDKEGYLIKNVLIKRDTYGRVIDDYYDRDYQTDLSTGGRRLIVTSENNYIRRIDSNIERYYRHTSFKNSVYTYNRKYGGHIDLNYTRYFKDKWKECDTQFRYIDKDSNNEWVKEGFSEIEKWTPLMNGCIIGTDPVEKTGVLEAKPGDKLIINVGRHGQLYTSQLGLIPRQDIQEDDANGIAVLEIETTRKYTANHDYIHPHSEDEGVSYTINEFGLVDIRPSDNHAGLIQGSKQDKKEILDLSSSNDIEPNVSYEFHDELKKYDKILLPTIYTEADIYTMYNSNNTNIIQGDTVTKSIIKTSSDNRTVSVPSFHYTLEDIEKAIIPSHDYGNVIWVPYSDYGIFENREVVDYNNMNINIPKANTIKLTYSVGFDNYVNLPTIHSDKVTDFTYRGSCNFLNSDYSLDCCLIDIKRFYSSIFLNDNYKKIRNINIFFYILFDDDIYKIGSEKRRDVSKMIRNDDCDLYSENIIKNGNEDITIKISKSLRTSEGLLSLSILTKNNVIDVTSCRDNVLLDKAFAFCTGNASLYDANKKFRVSLKSLLENYKGYNFGDNTNQYTILNNEYVYDTLNNFAKDADKIKDLSMHSINSEQIKSASYSFSNAESLTKLPIFSTNLSKVEDFEEAFSFTSSLPSNELLKIDYSSGNNFEGTFKYRKIETILPSSVIKRFNNKDLRMNFSDFASDSIILGYQNDIDTILPENDNFNYDVFYRNAFRNSDVKDARLINDILSWIERYCKKIDKNEDELYFARLYKIEQFFSWMKVPEDTNINFSLYNAMEITLLQPTILCSDKHKSFKSYNIDLSNYTDPSTYYNDFDGNINYLLYHLADSSALSYKVGSISELKNNEFLNSHSFKINTGNIIFKNHAADFELGIKISRIDYNLPEIYYQIYNPFNYDDKEKYFDGRTYDFKIVLDEKSTWEDYKNYKSYRTYPGSGSNKTFLTKGEKYMDPFLYYNVIPYNLNCDWEFPDVRPVPIEVLKETLDNVYANKWGQNVLYDDINPATNVQPRAITITATTESPEASAEIMRYADDAVSARTQPVTLILTPPPR